MNKIDKVFVDAVDKTDIEAEHPVEEEVASIDKFSIDALRFWREYLRQPKGRRSKTYRSRTSNK